MLTVIIPYFKISYFEETLKSLANQTDQRFKVFIGDDASPECPAELLRKYQGAFSFSYRRYSENLGGKNLTKHWERCLENVQSEWFMILGDDDQLTHNAIANFYMVANNPDNADYRVLRFQREIVDDMGNVIVERTAHPDKELSTDFLYKRSLNEVGSSLGEYIFKTEDYKKYGIKSYPKAFYSDNMMVLEYSDFKAVKNIDAVAKIRISPESLSGDITNRGSIRKAGWVFYLDIIREYGHHFSKKQLSHFFNILLGGVLADEPIISKQKFILLNLSMVGIRDSFSKMITLGKSL